MSARKLIEFAAGLMPPARDQLDSFTRAYIEAALDSLPDEDKERFESGVSVEDIAPTTLKRMVADCQKFQAEVDDVLSTASEHVNFPDIWSQAGYDFYQTRVGAGVGFWETSDWPEPYGPKLDEAAKAFGNVDIYVGDDRLIYQMGAEGDWRLKQFTSPNAAGGLVNQVTVRDQPAPADPAEPTFSIEPEDGDEEDPERLESSAQALVDRLLAEDELEGGPEEEDVICPICDACQPSSQCTLGGLGNRVHYRCRQCGGDWNRSKGGPAWGDSPGD